VKKMEMLHSSWNQPVLG